MESASQDLLEPKLLCIDVVDRHAGKRNRNPTLLFDAKQKVTARSVRKSRNRLEERDLVAVGPTWQLALVLDGLAFRDPVLDQGLKSSNIDVLDSKWQHRSIHLHDNRAARACGRWTGAVRTVVTSLAGRGV